jgi:hypothetical protein
MPETTDLPVDLPQPFVTFGLPGAVVIGGLASYGAVTLSRDVHRKVKSTLAARKIRKEIKAKDSTPTS